MKSVKKEDDDPGFDPSSPPNPSHHVQQPAPSAPSAEAAAATVSTAETFAIDVNLVATDIHEKICLVRTDGSNGNGKLWPALKFADKGELQEAMESDVKVPLSQLKLLQSKITVHGHHISGSIAYLFGRGKIERSLVALTDVVLAEDFHVHDGRGLKDKDGYRSDEEFQRAYDIALKRIHRQVDSNQEDDKDDELSSSNTVGYVDLCDSSDDEAVGQDDQDASSPGVAVGVGEQDYAADVTGDASDLERDGGDETASAAEEAANLPASRTNATLNATAKKRKGEGSVKDGNSKKTKKKKTPSSKYEKTPKSKTERAPAVTPCAKSDGDGAKELSGEEASNWISPSNVVYNVLDNATAWQLLEEKFGMKCTDGNYYLHSKVTPIATSLATLRKELCANGLPMSTDLLSDEEKVGIMRWVRYANVSGLTDGQSIDPSNDLGKPMAKFMDCWSILSKNFGCQWSSGKYNVSTKPEGGEKKRFERTVDVDRHFAQFGIQCIPDSVPEETLSKKDRLSIEIYYATPLFNVLNTFERTERGEHRTPRRTRGAVDYYEE
ncbi:hypothetical protein ACHAWF_007711 [Thalassiosira exigua]